MALLRSEKLDRETADGGLSVRAAKMPWRGRRGAGASGSTSMSSSSSGMEEMPCSSLSRDMEDMEVLREMFWLCDGSGFNWLVDPWAMNSQDGAVWGAVGGENGLLPGA